MVADSVDLAELEAPSVLERAMRVRSQQAGTTDSDPVMPVAS
jgi:hypothetical protein